MNSQEVYTSLVDKAPTGYRINDIISFSYPYRKLKLEILANKQPDNSLVNVYIVLVKAISSGFDTVNKLFTVLGLGKNDEFILRELYALREKGYIDAIGNQWLVTEEGKMFLKDNSILRVEEKEDFTFLIDGISGEIQSIREKSLDRKTDKHLFSEINHSIKNPELIKGRFQELADVYKSDNEGKSYLLNFDEKGIKEDFNHWSNFWLIEYIPERNSNQESKLEIRNYSSLDLDKALTRKFNSEYRYFLYNLNEERREIETIVEDIIEHSDVVQEVKVASVKNLTIWETKSQFIEALSDVSNRILIESPWIKRATQEYIPYFENLLKSNRKLILIYGISMENDHDSYTLEKLNKLKEKYSQNFNLIHLPSHLNANKSKLTGTHRKLVIKDDDYYISGSFNFLSFGKSESQRVANEESQLVRVEVKDKWNQISKEYNIIF